MFFSLKLAPLKFGALGGCLCRLCQEPGVFVSVTWIISHSLLCGCSRNGHETASTCGLVPQMAYLWRLV